MSWPLLFIFFLLLRRWNISNPVLKKTGHLISTIYFKNCKVDSRPLAEDEFKRNINEISTWDVNKRSKKLGLFCLNTIRNNFQLLKSNDAREYRIGISEKQAAITLKEVNVSQASGYAQSLLKITEDSVKMRREMKENELEQSYLFPLFDPFFSKKDKFKFRSTEECLPERKLRTQNIKRPDFMVSTVNINEFTFTRMIGEVKIGAYNQDSLQTMYDKYKLALFGKDCIDDDTEFIILSQTVGNDVRFYLMTVLDEAFCISVYLKSICLPLFVLDLKSFVNELNDIFSIRNLVSSISKVERNEKCDHGVHIG